MKNSRKTAIGIIAHVDSGKTTLSEAMLYFSGSIRKQGRVDHRDSFLDTDKMERERGITIFSKQAVLYNRDMKITLLDTPGHADFSAETERALWALDAVILVISGAEGVQSHTKTLWKMLERNKIPTFVFVNKMDIAHLSKENIVSALCKGLGGVFIDIDGADFYENAALCSESIMEEFLESGTVSVGALSAAFCERRFFPCCFGSALKNTGIESLFEAIYSLAPCASGEGGLFRGRVFKISQDESGRRLTHIKITGGSLSVKENIYTGRQNEKVNDIRIYSGTKYESVQTAYAGDVCAVCGLEDSFSGQGIGEQNAPALLSQPLFVYNVVIKNGVDKRVAFAQMKKLQQEETRLCVSYESHLGEIHLSVMGQVQLEVLQRTLKERFDIEAEFEQGGILYKETIKAPAEGVGHFEPLRHYAEVHLLLEPLERGKGMVFEADCPEAVLSKNWQRLILTHLAEKEHKGVLTGAPITDIKITLKSGRAHQKHTEGGDFRQATYRAVRQGLLSAQSVLLEPYYDFSLSVPNECVGRAMTDLDAFGAQINPPVLNGDVSVITGRAAAEKMCHYQRSVTAYTKGRGILSFSPGGYEECKDAAAVIEKTGYDYAADLENTADSVFCAQGAGFTVPWDRVFEYMHLESIFAPKKDIETPIVRKNRKRSVTDEELMEIFERTYGKIERKLPEKMRPPRRHSIAQSFDAKTKKNKREGKYLLIDGYNIIFASDAFKAMQSIEQARDTLCDMVADYALFNPCEVILVFDAYRVKGGLRSFEKVRGINIVYTKEAETADSYIERVSHELGKKHFVSVATSDAPEQMIIFGSGAQRIPARDFLAQLDKTQKEIAEVVKIHNARENITEI